MTSISKRNWAARELRRNKLYQPKVVKAKTVYSRKNKHKEKY